MHPMSVASKFGENVQNGKDDEMRYRSAAAASAVADARVK